MSLGNCKFGYHHTPSRIAKVLLLLSNTESQRVTQTEQLHFHFSCIGEGNGNPLQCSCLENPRDRGAWWAAVYGVAQCWKGGILTIDHKLSPPGLFFFFFNLFYYSWFTKPYLVSGIQHSDSVIYISIQNNVYKIYIGFCSSMDFPVYNIKFLSEGLLTF